ncbi:glycoside hydrolase family 10 protein [Bacteroides sp. 51]|uniref:glycoside hydrolase family 10 protein n=1 Tax=Bacteroides sp. 51 TaxID=2302938 RepID=UPI001EF32D17|nr:family 10 glycosylhydrolase [Bacteroides sp. 51]
MNKLFTTFLFRSFPLILLAVFMSSCQRDKSSANTPEETLETGIRGVWVPAPRFTDVLHTYDNVKDFVKVLDDLNMNALFLVSYAGTETIFKSDVLTKYSTYQSSSEGYMLRAYMQNYQSATNDPVRDLLDEAHKRGIKVFFWFEYGFMGEGKPIPATNPLLAKNPTWLGMGNDKLPANYNHSDYYYNAYNPAVQQFLLELVEEAITLYPDVDGIQGDDRMPAMPRNSGYDDYTVALYKEQHGGQAPPADCNDAAWVRWRLDLLNDFARRLHQRVKAKGPDVMVSFAPNPYPWCEEKLMQEWPQWCKEGLCDVLAVQCYRYSGEAYRSTVTEVLKYIKSSNPKQVFAPGMILMEGGNAKMTPELLKEQLEINRQLGVNSEIYFYNKAITDPELQRVWKEMYQQKLAFPMP